LAKRSVEVTWIFGQGVSVILLPAMMMLRCAPPGSGFLCRRVQSALLLLCGASHALNLSELRGGRKPAANGDPDAKRSSSSHLLPAGHPQSWGGEPGGEPELAYCQKIAHELLTGTALASARLSQAARGPF
jgi:hypothetical protein